jgi:hypothetical protein
VYTIHQSTSLVVYCKVFSLEKQVALCEQYKNIRLICLQNKLLAYFWNFKKEHLQSERNQLPITYLEKLKFQKLEKKSSIACMYAQTKFVIELNFIDIPYSPTGPKRQQISYDEFCWVCMMYYIGGV